jgi:pSer/pThr/pTyr-binding forkhead associated (FHA) protein
VPKLVAVDGPLKGATYAIAGDRFSIGRKSYNTLAHADLSISRRHCTIEFLGGRVRIADHESQNGTFVNGIPVRERVLAHGDQIAVGVSVFVFLFEGAGPLPLSPPLPNIPSWANLRPSGTCWTSSPRWRRSMPRC